MLEAINQHSCLSLPNHLPPKWVVDCRAVGEELPTLKYLSRYLYRGVLPDKDIINITKDNVTFRYRDGQTNHWKQRTLPTLKFLMLMLQHVLPKGLQRARDYGFLRGNAKAILHQIQCLLLPLLQQLLGIAATEQTRAHLPLLPAQHALHWHQPTEITTPQGRNKDNGLHHATATTRGINRQKQHTGKK